MSFALRLGSGLAAASLTLASVAAAADQAKAAASYHQTIKPLLTKYCFDCHADGTNKGGVSFDEFASDAAMLAKPDLWLKALRNVRAGVMPPREEGDEKFRPTSAEIETLAQWVKFQALGIDPQNPDPGRVTVRRLNRVEYRNTIRDLMGTDFNAEAEFPPDDTGNGFDNIGDVLTISPLLLEKYLTAADAIVERAVPKVGRVMKEIVAVGRDFRPEAAAASAPAGGETAAATPAPAAGGGGGGRGPGGVLSVKRATTVAKKFTVERDDTYKLAVDLEIRGSFDFDPDRCSLILRADGKELFKETIEWSEKQPLNRQFDLDLKTGEHVVSFEVVPLAPVVVAKAEPPPEAAPAAAPAPAATAAKEGAPAIAAVVDGVANAAAGEVVPPVPGAAALTVRRPQAQQRPASRLDVAILSVKLSGPRGKEFWIAPENHARFFPDGPAPEEPAARDAYAEKVIRRFATRAFRRPVENKKVAQLVQVARNVYTQPNKTFEQGVGQAIMAVLASPNFIFRVEQPEQPQKTASAAARFAPIDEYALASRLSYFFWATMPDDELFGLAERGELRRQLPAQVKRMLADTKANQGIVKTFVGQWLQARDIEFVPINARAVLGISTRGRNDNAPRVDFDGPLRKFMRSETEMYFEHVLREDRSVVELIDSNYAFLNERLATHYGVPDVSGAEIRRVELPAGSVRGGILTQGTFLAVTSNPTRTSPVKRGLFVLENILGTPPPPAPPNVPDLEEAKKEFGDREPKVAEMLAAHRTNPLCSSCHERMDPLGLAFENFNAMGTWREEEAKQPIDPSGVLATGEKFKDVRELKRILANERRIDFYRCITEKMLTYALGRGLDYYDTHAVDTIVDSLVKNEGRMSALISGVVESAPFQKQRLSVTSPSTASLTPQL